MKSADQSFNNNQETTAGTGLVAQWTRVPSFRNMLEQFYERQCPPDPADPKFVPLVNLKERRQK